RHLVGRAASGERNDDRDRLVGIVGEDRRRESEQNEAEGGAERIHGAVHWVDQPLSRPASPAPAWNPRHPRREPPQRGGRRSSITLPSLGRRPGTTSSTSPRSRVTSRIVRATC